MTVDVTKIATEFYEWWLRQPRLPAAPVTASEMRDIPKKDAIVPRNRVIEFLHQIKTEYAWTGDQCRQASLALRVLKEAVESTRQQAKGLSVLWRALGVTSLASLGYLGQAWVRDKDLDQLEKAAIIVFQGAFIVSHVAKWATTVALEGLEENYKTMRQDIFWRCLPHDVHIGLWDSQDSKSPEAEGINYAPVAWAQRPWTAMDKGHASHDDVPEMMLGLVSGSSLVIRGGSWLFQSIARVLPREIHIPLPTPVF